ncbi:unnamed protein product, partial [Iphiclides podalirius]
MERYKIENENNHRFIESGLTLTSEGASSAQGPSSPTLSQQVIFAAGARVHRPSPTPDESAIASRCTGTGRGYVSRVAIRFRTSGTKRPVKASVRRQAIRKRLNRTSKLRG